MKNNKTALITGASSGIGLELSKLFAKDNYDLILIARDEKKLNEVSDLLKKEFQTSVLVIKKDLSKSNSSMEIYEEIKKKEIEIEVLVNNAGFATYGDFSELDTKRELEMIQVNMVTLTHLTKLFLPDMIKRKHGKILNLASTAAFQPGPHMAVYFASKAYVLSFSQAIANELLGTGVSVTVLCPGPTKTNFEKTTGQQNYFKFKNHVMKVEDVAKIGYEGLMKNKSLVIPGFRNRFLSHAAKMTPGDVAAKIVRRIQG